jgi:uncharacterized membrane protein YphA (DoxX/SURF4 family)
MNRRWSSLAGLALSVVLSLGFLSSGLPKLMNAEVPAIEFAVWGYPQWMLYGVGFLEVLGAVCIWHRPWAPWGFGMLSVVVAGALLTHLRFEEWQALHRAAAFAVVLAAAAWWRLIRCQPSGQA